MNAFTRFMEYDGSLSAVFTHRTVQDTIVGTVWRFIADGKTILVIPCQCELAPAKQAHCVPERIESIFRHLAWAFHYVQEQNVDNEVRGWQANLNDKVGRDIEAWKAQQKLPATVSFKEARRKAQQSLDTEWRHAGVESGREKPTPEQAQQWRNQGLTPEQIEQKTKDHEDAVIAKRKELSEKAFSEFKAVRDSPAYRKEQGRIEERRRKIEAKYQKEIDRKKRQRAAEIRSESLAEIRRFLSVHGVVNVTMAKLEKLLDFARDEVFQGEGRNVLIRDQHLRRMLAKIEELTGTDLTERAIMAYSPWMESHIDEWANETAQLKKIEKSDARRRLLRRVRFVAVFPDGSRHLVQSLVCCVHDEQDVELFRIAAPSEAARAEIEKTAQIEAEKRKTIRLQELAARYSASPTGGTQHSASLPYVNQLGEGRAAGENMVKRAILRELFTGPAGSKSYIFKEAAKDPTKQFKLGSWEGNRKAALYDIRDFGFGIEDLRKLKKNKAD